MTKDEAMQMALKWIEAQHEPRMIGAWKTIQALRAALAQPDVPETAFGDKKIIQIALKNGAWETDTGELVTDDLNIMEFSRALRAAITQPDTVWHELSDKDADELKAAIEKKGRKPDPVAWVWEINESSQLFLTLPQGWNPIPLYTAPPQREWVGLTDDERKDIFKSCGVGERGYVAAMVEAKLKEKNT